MQQRHILVNHPYFDDVLEDGDGYRVTLSSDFPIRTFRIWRVESRWDDCIEMTADLGIKGEHGQVDWLRGAGTTAEEAVVDTLTFFLNLVVHPSGLQEIDVVFREAAA